LPASNDDVLVRVKYWEIIADKSQESGLEFGAVSQARITRADNSGLCRRAQRPGRFIVHADEMRAAFLELQAAIHRRFEPQMESHA